MTGSESGKPNGNAIRMAEFKGEVIATLRYLKEQQEKHRNEVNEGLKEQREELKNVCERVDKHLKKTAVVRWMLGAIIGWLTAITTVLVKLFVL